MTARALEKAHREWPDVSQQVSLPTVGPPASDTGLVTGGLRVLFQVKHRRLPVGASLRNAVPSRTASPALSPEEKHGGNHKTETEQEVHAASSTT